jgi:carboxypeptidase C (cathepsin A)
MKKILFLVLLTTFQSFVCPTKQFQIYSHKTVAKDEKPSPANLVFNPDENVVTEHTTTIKGQKISYKATTGTMPVWDDGKAIAGLFYTYYERSDVKDRASRPLVISFNGPGSASVGCILHTLPSLLNIDDEGYPLQPYGIKETPILF